MVDSLGCSIVPMGIVMGDEGWVVIRSGGRTVGTEETSVYGFLSISIPGIATCGNTYLISEEFCNDGSKDVLSCRLDEAQLRQFYSEQFSRLEIDENEPEDKPCEAGRTFGCISATGDVYPCIQIPLKVGNVFEKEFRDIWRDADMLKKMRNFKVSEIKACMDCDMVSCCTICPGLAYLEDGDLFGPRSPGPKSGGDLCTGGAAGPAGFGGCNRLCRGASPRRQALIPVGAQRRQSSYSHRKSVPGRAGSFDFAGAVRQNQSGRGRSKHCYR